jgi:acyl-CoA reductase-like NAD-dependent aldehyde dehydrogenase
MEQPLVEMSASRSSRTETPRTRLDETVGRLADHARTWAALDATQRADLLRECAPRLQAVARRWVAAAAEAKGLTLDEPAISEEWLGGPMTTMRNLRLLERSLREISVHGKPQVPPPWFGTTPQGNTDVRVFPVDSHEGVLQAGFSARIRFAPGMTQGEVRERQASAYGKKGAEGGVALILGAGNVASIPPMDAFYKLFAEGRVALIKMNPVNEYLGPIYEEALEPLVRRGYLAVVYGGAEVGAHLVEHPAVADVHITGSIHAHDFIVWGATAEERERRKAARDPKLKKPITSELGCVTPVVLVPGRFSPKELRFVAENVATMKANNGGFNCNAATMLVTSRAWPQREAFFTELKAVLSSVRPRLSYYPGAGDRHARAVAGRDQVELLGPKDDKRIPWTLLRGLSPATEDPLFVHESFCPVLAEVTLEESDPAGFLAAATRFCNEKLWGTLSMMLMIHPDTERDPEVSRALSTSVATLKYGAVAINQWAGLAYGMVTTPWGGHPSSTLEDAQGGLGWVHNTFLYEGIEKCVVRGPLTVSPRPPWFVTHKNAHRVAERLFELECAPSWLKVPGIALAALKG